MTSPTQAPHCTNILQPYDLTNNGRDFYLKRSHMAVGGGEGQPHRLVPFTYDQHLKNEGQLLMINKHFSRLNKYCAAPILEGLTGVSADLVEFS